MIISSYYKAIGLNILNSTEMTNYKLKVVKKHLKEMIPDIHPNFDKLEGLHLDLLENKKKLKSGLPLIPIKRTIVKKSPHTSPLPKEEFHHSKEKEDIESEQDIDDQIEDDFIKELGVHSHSDDEVHSDRNERNEEHDENEQPENEEPEQGEPELSPEEQEEDERLEYLIRFKILKKQYPSYSFPTYTDHTDLHTLKRLYKDTLKMINLDTNVDNYKTIMQVSFFGIELLACKMGLDFNGFAKFQFKKMEKYERLLVELGEKSYSNFAANRPVEVRLLGMILLDAGVFYIGKIVAEHSGEGVANMFSMLFGMPPPGEHKKNQKMRGPKMKPEDIRNMAKND